MAVLWLLLALAAIPGGPPGQSKSVCELTGGVEIPRTFQVPGTGWITHRGGVRHTSAKGNEDLPQSGGWGTEETTEQWSSECHLQTRSISIT